MTEVRNAAVQLLDEEGEQGNREFTDELTLDWERVTGSSG
jgi:hypothetical protein